MPNWNLPWFTKWNKDNPTDVFGPAIAVGVVGGGVVFTALVIAWGWPLAVESQQTGPAGTGMSVPEFVSDLEQPDPTVEAYLELQDGGDAPEAEAAAAADAAENGEEGAQAPEEPPIEIAYVSSVIPGVSDARAEELVRAMRAWTGIPDLLGPEANYQAGVALRMIQMTQFLNEVWAGHVNANGEAGVNCYTCHRGQPVPSGIWFKIAPQLEVAEGWGAVANYATEQTVSTSLPHDALEKLLLEDGQINVHDLEPRVAGVPGMDGLPSIQDTERTYSLMNYFSDSLGANCVFCHNSRAFYDPAQVTPQWATALLGIDMVQETNNEYLVPLQGVYPENRLGPDFGDAPKAACLTCHKGYQKPMGGMDMVSDWPELAAQPAE